jgi:hypothetical protein
MIVKYCKHCHSRNIFFEEDDGEKTKCNYCDLDFEGEVLTHTDRNPEAKPSTHSQFTVLCKKCGFKEVRWVKRRKRVKTCSNCGAERKYLVCKSTGPLGNIENIWKSSKLASFF